MKQTELFNQYLEQCPLIAILRGITLQEVKPVCDALYQAGIRLLEVPLNTPGATECIDEAVKHSAGRQLVGAGTVLTVQEVRDVKAAGGEFIISPNTDTEVIVETVRQNLLSIPGFMTASEAFTAIKAGADYLKLFPAGALGAGYVKDLKAVVKKPIFAVGGVNAQNIPQFMEVCAGVGIGGALYKKGKTLDALAADAREMAELVIKQ